MCVVRILQSICSSSLSSGEPQARRLSDEALLQLSSDEALLARLSLGESVEFV